MIWVQLECWLSICMKSDAAAHLWEAAHVLPQLHYTVECLVVIFIEAAKLLDLAAAAHGLKLHTEHT
jgi:hypothetical protein